MYKIIVLLSIVCLVKCEGIYEKCGDKVSCIEQELVKVVNQLDEEHSLKLVGDYVTLEKTKNETARSDEGLMERCIRYLDSHELKLKLPSTDTSRNLVVESRARRLKKLILPLLLLLKLKAVVIIPLLLTVVAIVAFKGLGVGLISLVIAGVNGLKSLVDGHHHHPPRLTYEIVPSPHWSRSGMEALVNQGYAIS